MGLSRGLHRVSEARSGPTFKELLVRTDSFLSAAFRDDRRIPPTICILCPSPVREGRRIQAVIYGALASVLHK